MTVLNTEKSLLLIIDIQEKLLNAAFNKDVIKAKSEILAKTAEILNIPCIITEQYPKGLGNTISEVSSRIKAEKTYIYEKIQFNALEEFSVFNKLKELGKKQIILCGIETHICVRQTAYALLSEGFEVSIARDCTGSRFEHEYLSGLEVMRQEGAYIKTTEMILFEFLKSAKHQNFKEIQSLIK